MVSLRFSSSVYASVSALQVKKRDKTPGAGVTGTGGSGCRESFSMFEQQVLLIMEPSRMASSSSPV